MGTVRSTVLAAPPAIVKDKSGGGHAAVGLDPINVGVQPGCTAARSGWYSTSKK